MGERLVRNEKVRGSNPLVSTIYIIITTRSYCMKISIESQSRIKMIPETEHEKESLEALWKILIRCEKESKTLCPIGEYIPSKNDGANFVIQDTN